MMKKDTSTDTTLSEAKAKKPTKKISPSVVAKAEAQTKKPAKRTVAKVVKAKPVTKKPVAKKPAAKKKVASKRTTKPAKAKTTSIVMSSPIDPSLQIVMASELADDQMIEQELLGATAPFFIYRFCKNKPACKSDEMDQCRHQKVTGLTVKGVTEVVRRLNRNQASGYKIRMNPKFLQIERDVTQDGELGVSVSVYAEDLINGNSSWGSKFEPYMKVGRNGQYKNEFALEKALSKAERNAKRRLIPEPAAIKMIELLMQEQPEMVRDIEPPKDLPRIVQPRKLTASTPQELEEITMAAIRNAKTPHELVKINQGVQGSDKFNEAAKDRLRQAGIARGDQLTGGGQGGK